MSSITNEHFDLFVIYCKNWIHFFSIYDWEIGYQFRETDSDDAKASFCVSDIGNRVGTIVLYDDFGFDLTDENYAYVLSKVAFHEVVEVLMADVCYLAESRGLNETNRYDREHHRVVRLLENSVHWEMWKTVNVQRIDIQSPAKGKKGK